MLNVIIMSLLYLVKTNRSTIRLSRRRAIVGLMLSLRTAMIEFRHSPCVTMGSHNFTCHPHTDQLFLPFGRYQLILLHDENTQV